MEQIIKIAVFILDSFVHIWPYLLISIPLAVAVQITGAAKFINKALSKNPVVSILLATIVGAFSPFCSCGVIPVIASLLIGGVPLAPVMSFWIASPSMDPEIFFLSVATIGWKLSVWRLTATFAISLSSGYITHFAILNGFIGKDILRQNQASPVKKPWQFFWTIIIDGLRYAFASMKSSAKVSVQLVTANNSIKQQEINCCVAVKELDSEPEPINPEVEKSCNTCAQKGIPTVSFGNRLSIETWKASLMIVKFMTLAFFINALITFYVPQDFISSLLGGDGALSVVIASLVGIPAYTSNLTALPLVSGLLSLGMNPGAALAFLIAGPTTTLPAMIAVWGITKRKIFLLYISFSLIGAMAFGLLFNIVN
nr:permease [Bacteroidota bacterium]